MGKLKAHSPTCCIMDNWEKMLHLTHTLILAGVLFNIFIQLHENYSMLHLHEMEYGGREPHLLRYEHMVR